ncbi:MAG: response regulator [Phycisphaerae bacterium]|nr:response regulator [Phycisphaerae bacterium]
MCPYQGRSVLVVDDEASTRLLLRAAFEDVGMQVTEAVDGADAIHKSLEAEFDLTTMDILMPNVDGLDAIRAMRMIDPGYRIIVISSCEEPEVREAARELGVPSFLGKPIHLTALYQAVSAELSREESAVPNVQAETSGN